MQKEIEEYINHLKQSAVENKKESDQAYENGDLGLSGYLRGHWIANEGIAIVLETILNQHREKEASSDLLK